MYILGVVIFVLSVTMYNYVLDFDGFWNLLDPVAVLVVVLPIVSVLAATRSFKTFFMGLKAAINPKHCFSPESAVQITALYKLLSKVTLPISGLAFFISLLNQLIRVPYYTGNIEFAEYLGFSVAVSLIPLIYGLMFIIIVLQPVLFSLEKNISRAPSIVPDASAQPTSM